MSGEPNTSLNLATNENQIRLLLLEGDVSDIEIDLEEDEGEEIIFSNKSNDESEQPENIQAVGLTIELDTAYDEDLDDVPLSERLSYATRRPSVLVPEYDLQFDYKLPRWRLQDISPVPSDCNVNFTEPPHDINTPVEYFRMFIDSEIISNIVQQTNLYSTQITGTSINTNVNEIDIFLGIHIMSGIVRVPSYRMYWHNSTRYSLIADAMSRNRFDKLRTYFHLNDNDKMVPREDPNYDKLFKVRPFIEVLRKIFATIEPDEYNSVDELIIPFKGRSSLKQFNKNKPHKWGIKVFARAGSTGIIYDFEIYIGKGTNVKTFLGISGDIVLRLVAGLPKNENYKIFFDNWFSSHALVTILKNEGFLCVGTVRMNRLRGCTLKSDAELKRLGRGSYDYRLDVENNILALKWYDNRCVHLITSYKGCNPVDIVQRWSLKDKKHIQVERPSTVKEYNSYMGGVDLNNMLVELYRCDIRAKRFYLRIIFHLIDMAIVNAWLLYRRHCQQRRESKHQPLMEFRSDIARALIQAGKFTQKKRGRPSDSNTSSLKKINRRIAERRPIDDIRYDEIGHLPVHVEKKQRCKQCIKGFSRVRCQKCNVELCLNKDRNCYKIFHSK